MKRFFLCQASTSPGAKQGRVARMLLPLLACSILSFALTFVTTPSAHATTFTPTCYSFEVAGSSQVYDSYNHLEGQLDLIFDECTNGWAGLFISNTNTWKTVTVYVEYAYVYGYLQGGPYGWASNTWFWSPYYHGTSCYYAEVDLLDNRGIHNWVGTPRAGQGC